MANEVNQIIDNICTKLGYAASEITPEMARHEIIGHAGFVALGAFIIFCGIVCLYCGRKVRLEEKEELDWPEGYATLVIGGLILFGIGFLIDAWATVRIMQWAYAPKASMVEWVLSQVKGGLF